jgi:glutamate-1-semialdehyde 2,1-aminomutase
MHQTLMLSAVAMAVLAGVFPLARRRLQLSLAKHPSLTGHTRLAKRAASLVPGYSRTTRRPICSCFRA